MTSASRAAQTVKAQGSDVARSRAFEIFARSGFISRGLIYGIVGLLALKLALGEGDGKATSQQGALQTIAHQPFGKALLTATAVGLAGYSIWRLVRAALGHGIEVHDSAFDRVAGAASGLVYAALCAAAISILLGPEKKGSEGAQETTAGVLGWPAGTWIVGAAGLGFIGVAIYQGHKGITKSFLDDSKTEQMSASAKRAITVLGVVGHLSRMVVFGLVGYFLVRAAIDYKPSEAVGLDGVLRRLEENSYGPVLLGIVAAGLIAFALYSLSDARYRRI